MKFYCLRCGQNGRKEIKGKEMSLEEVNIIKGRAFKEIENPEEVIKETKRGKVRMAKSVCPDCGCVMYKILGRG